MPSFWDIERILTLPQLLRWRIRDSNDLDRFGKLRSAKLVTFDVFDTALLRSVAHPLDALVLVAWRAERRHNLGIGTQPLFQARLAAEKEARRLALAAGKEEVTLDEIYDRLSPSLAAARVALQAEELSTERDLCRSNPVILATYKKLIVSGTPVAFLSDTSLPQDFLRQLLAENGYDGPHRVFASSAFGKSKWRGGLFPAITRELGIEPHRVWHIGDNARSDVAQARRAGINGLWYRPTLRRPRYQDQTKIARDERALAKSLLAGISDVVPRKRGSLSDLWNQVGLCVAGPVYLGFTQWLMERLVPFAPKRMYFFSRDGQIVQRVYDRLRASCHTAPESSYLMVSRRALVIPAFERIDEVALEQFVGRDNQLWLPVDEYLTRIGLDVAACRAAMIEHGLPPGTLVDTEEKRCQLQRLFHALEPQVLAVAKRERSLLVRYLEQEGCFESDKFALCDIGWNGSMQRALASILKSVRPAAQISGYYVGTHKYIQRLAACSAGDAVGWLIDSDAPENRRRVLQSGLAVVELLFTANHGSVLNYSEQNGKAVPVLARLGITVDYVRAAEAVQEAALVFVDRYLKAFGGLTPLPLHTDDIFAPLARLIDCPTLAEAKAIGDLVQVDGLGTGTAHFGQPIAQPPSFWQALTKPSTIMKKFLQAPWRLAFLARLIGSPRLAFAAMMLRRQIELRSKPV